MIDDSFFEAGKDFVHRPLFLGIRARIVKIGILHFTRHLLKRESKTNTTNNTQYYKLYG